MIQTPLCSHHSRHTACARNVRGSCRGKVRLSIARASSSWTADSARVNPPHCHVIDKAIPHQPNPLEVKHIHPSPNPLHFSHLSSLFLLHHRPSTMPLPSRFLMLEFYDEMTKLLPPICDQPSSEGYIGGPECPFPLPPGCLYHSPPHSPIHFTEEQEEEEEVDTGDCATDCECAYSDLPRLSPPSPPPRTHIDLTADDVDMIDLTLE